MNGRVYLMHEGHRYCKASDYSGKTYWRCFAYSRYGCKARIISRYINGFEMMKMTCSTHSHFKKPKQRKLKPKLKPVVKAEVRESDDDLIIIE